MRERIVTYREFQSLVAELAQWLERHEIDGVCSIGRGGLPAGVELSHRLDVPHGMVDACCYEDRELTEFEFGGQLTTKLADADTVAVVDDIADSGRTLGEVVDHVSIDAELVTATLFADPGADPQPDYTAAYSKEWIVFPWEVHE